MKLHCLLVGLFLFASCAQVPTAPTSKLNSTDTHMHIHPSLESENMKFNGERALFAANSVGIQRVIVLSNSYSKSAYRDYARTQNSFVAREAKKHPSKIAGACAVNPIMDWALEEIKRCKQDGLKILKLHTIDSGMDLRKQEDLAELKKVFNLASEFKMTVLIHGNMSRAIRGSEADILVKTISDFPKIRFIIGHLMGRELDALKNFKHPNFLLEVSVLPPWMTEQSQKDNLVKAMKEIGLQHFVFGSNWPIYHPAELLHALQELPFTSAELEDIAYHNSKALDDLF